MKMRIAKYFLVYTTPAVVWYSIGAGDIRSYSALLLLFGVIPALELLLKGSTHNLTAAEEEVAQKDIGYDLLLYGLVPAQYLILFFYLTQIGREDIAFGDKVGMVTAFGLACGVLGINAAHELGHRNTWYEQLMSKMLLLTTLYMHFFIEHNRGHHKNVATQEDPATSRYSETVYAFFLRTIPGSWLSAWRLEGERLRNSGRRFWSWHNEMLRFQVIQALFLFAIYFIFGPTVLKWYLPGAVMGFLLLETVNYIEHYGLQRKKNGKYYEHTLPVHSWNSNHPLGRMILLELSRHSDHHYKANRKYQILRHFDDSPQMPTGYPGMMLLALVPPLWFWVMHRAIKALPK